MKILTNQSGFIPLPVIYVLLAATCFGGIAGIAAYMLTDTSVNVLLLLSAALILAFIIAVVPEIVNSANNKRKSFKQWCRKFDSGGNRGQ